VATATVRYGGSIISRALLCEHCRWSATRGLKLLKFDVGRWALNVRRFPAMIRRAIYPGSFDPVTNGHLDVIERARKLFDEVIVAVAHNDQKHPLFSLDERLDLLRGALGKIKKVEIAPLRGLLVDFAIAKKATAVIRGLRAISDFEFEFQMALMNRKLEARVETIFLMPKEEYTYLSSRIVKEIARLGGDVREFVPRRVAKALGTKVRDGTKITNDE
jgi:pantetheine-phosphate adenylyltransferase